MENRTTIIGEASGSKMLYRKSISIQVLSKLLTNKFTIFSLIILLGFVLVTLLSYLGILAKDWSAEVGGSYESPSLKHFFGTDIFGRSVLLKIIKGTEVAFSVGFVVSIISIFIGVLLGLMAGYFGGIIDEIIIWFYTTVSSIPNIMLLIAITFILGKGIVAVYIALGLTRWVEICRLIRAEVIKHKNREYILAATAIGASHFRKLFRHILPNIYHIIIVQFSLIFQIAIKSEVILSFLGLGVQNRPSWGIMISDAKVEVSRGVWWQLVFSTLAMFLVVLAFNILIDALRDALDPKISKINT